MILDYAVADWLPSKNYYYNTRTCKISDNINDLIEHGHVQYEPEGLCNYLDYGFSVFGQTIIDEIKMLEPNMRVSHDSKGNLIVEHLDDPFDKLLAKETNEEEALRALKDCINDWANSHNDIIILPLSGGFDSRLMLSMIEDKDRVFAFTYGISDRQDESYEVVYAKAIAQKLGVKWQHIMLNEYSKYIDEWNELFGVTTHAHGMYHMEFYKKIREVIGNKGKVLSGILGDVYAGSWRFDTLYNASDLRRLGVTHGVHADSTYCILKNDRKIEKDFYSKNSRKLRDENWRVLTAARMKSSLLTYLLRTPETAGFNSWSPFLDADVVAKMMTLPWRAKSKRKWQIEYFKRKGLLVGEWGLQCSKENVLDRNEFRKYTFEKLDISCIGELFDKEYINEINNCIDSGSILNESCERELNAWFTIIPIQKMIRKYG